jgi:hypothetical protein
MGSSSAIPPLKVCNDPPEMHRRDGAGIKPGLRQVVRDHLACGSVCADARSQGIAQRLAGVSRDELFVFQYSDVPPQPTPGVRRPIDRLTRETA